MLEEITSAQQIGFPILSALILLPAAMVAVLGLLKARRLVYPVALSGAVLTLLLSLILVRRFQVDAPHMQFVERLQVGSLFSYHVGVDGISVLFVPLCALLALLVTLYAQQVAKADARHYLMAIFGLEAALIGAFVSLDLLLFWLFTALEIVPGSLLIRRWGTGPRRQEAARKYVEFSLMSVALMLAAVLLLGYTYHALHAPAEAGNATGGSPFDLSNLLTSPLPMREQVLVFFLLFFALSVRVPLFPFHGWLPIVLEEGPVVGVSVFLVGVKLGAYGFLRFVIPLAPEAAQQWCWLVTLLAVVGMVYGALLALVQTNLRRLLAFACLSHMGSVMVGLFSFNVPGMEGGLLAMLNVGIAAAALFFVAGFLQTRVGSAELAELGGLSQYVPLLSLTFLIVSLAIIGMPGTSGFDAEHLVMEGALDAHHWPMAAAAGAGSLLEAAYLFRYYQRAFLGSSRALPAPGKLRDLRPRELIIAASFGLLIVGIGLFSGPLLHTMNGPLEALAHRMEHGAHVHKAVADTAKHSHRN